MQTAKFVHLAEVHCDDLYCMRREEQVLHRLATAYRTVFAKIDLTASDQHAGFALAAALQACFAPPSNLVCSSGQHI